MLWRDGIERETGWMMSSALIEGLKFLRRRIKSPWVWWPVATAVTLCAGFFGLWTSFPGPVKEQITRWVVSPFTTVDGVYVERFAGRPDGDSEVQFLRSKVERNVAKLLWSNHVSVGSSMSQSPQQEPSYRNKITGYVERTPDARVSIYLTLRDARDRILASGELTSDAGTLTQDYESIPETLLYAAGIDVHRLPAGAPISPPDAHDHRRPTAMPEAYLHLVEAQRLMSMNRPARALVELAAATRLDPSFATAWWSQGEIYRALHQDDEARAAYAQARKISREYPRPPIVNRDVDPWPYLVSQGASGWKVIAAGVERIELSIPAARVSVRAWQFDSTRYSIQTRWAESQAGKAVGGFLTGKGSVLAVNGGFFDMSNDDQLTPSGLLVVNRRPISALNDNSSGLLLVVGHSIHIEPVKSPSAVSLAAQADFALQSGPLLVEHGANGILSDDGQRQRRAAVCITRDHFSVIVVDDRGLSLFQLGKLLALPASEGGFGCDDALNLDGGPSVQVAYDFKGVKESIAGLWNVADALVVKAM